MQKQLTGYELFKAQGRALKTKKPIKNRAVTNPPTTPVKSSPISIEELVIEKKEGFVGLKIAQAQVFKQQEAGRISPSRIVDNRNFVNEVLPDEVTALVDNKAYLPRHKLLARQHGVKQLTKLAELAKTKAKPSHWYAKVTSKANWEQTLEMLDNLFKALHKAQQALEKVGIMGTKWVYYYTKACSKLSEAQISNAVELATAKGVKAPPRMFATAISRALKPTPA